MKALRIFGLISAIYALAGCSTYALVSNETYNNANLSSYHTFHIVTPDEGKLAGSNILQHSGSNT